MAIDWTIFKENLKNYLDNYIAKSEDDIAKYISDLYEISILNGNEQYGNKPMSYNKKLLENALKLAFNLIKLTNDKTKFSSIVSSGLIQFWSGATLSHAVPPPGSVSIISNSVSTPGSTVSMMLNNSTTSDIFIDSFVNLCQIHLASITGMVVALVPQPSGTPVPTPFPWVGIQ